MVVSTVHNIGANKILIPVSLSSQIIRRSDSWVAPRGGGGYGDSVWGGAGGGNPRAIKQRQAGIVMVTKGPEQAPSH